MPLPEFPDPGLQGLGECRPLLLQTHDVGEITQLRHVPLVRDPVQFPPRGGLFQPTPFQAGRQTAEQRRVGNGCRLGDGLGGGGVGQTLQGDQVEEGVNRLGGAPVHLPGCLGKSQVRQEITADPQNRSQEQGRRCRGVPQDQLHDEPDRGGEQSRRGQHQLLREEIGDAPSRQQEKPLLVLCDRQPEGAVQPLAGRLQSPPLRMCLAHLGSGPVQEGQGVGQADGGSQATDHDQEGTGSDRHSRHHERSQGSHLSSPSGNGRPVSEGSCDAVSTALPRIGRSAPAPGTARWVSRRGRNSRGKATGPRRGSRA